MSTAENLFVQTSPALAATTFPAMRSVPVRRHRGWPETLALGGYMAILASALAAGGAVNPLASAGLSLIAFALLALLALCSTGRFEPAQGPTRQITVLMGAVAIFPFAQAAASLLDAPALASMTPRESLLDGVRGMGYLALFIGLRHSLIGTHMARRAAMLLLGALGTIATAALLFYDPELRPLSHPGLTGPLENRSAFAALMGTGLCLALAFATQPAHPRAHRPVFILFRTTCILAGAVLFVAILQTQSRLGLASALLASATILALRMPRHVLRWAGLGSLFLVIVLLYAEPAVLDRFTTLPSDFENRAAFYRQVAQMIAQAPFLGHGAGSFALAFEHIQRPPVSAALVWDYAHSTVLSMSAELGLPMALSATGAVILAGAALARRFRKNGDATALAACAALVLAVPHWLADFSYEIPALAYFLIALTALGLGPKSPPRKEETP